MFWCPVHMASRVLSYLGHYLWAHLHLSVLCSIQCSTNKVALGSLQLVGRASNFLVRTFKFQDCFNLFLIKTFLGCQLSGPFVKHWWHTQCYLWHTYHLWGSQIVATMACILCPQPDGKDQYIMWRSPYVTWPWRQWPTQWVAHLDGR